MKRILIVSPHLDDAVLSCGPYIITNVKGGNSITIATVFTQSIDPQMLSPLAKWFHGICGLGDNAMEVRCIEDKKACKFLNVDFVHLNLPECLYRLNFSGAPSYLNETDIYLAKVEDEMETVSQLCSSLSSIQIDKFDEILIPLGIGRHIDHLIVRRAVEELKKNRDALRCKILYYEDTPYVCSSRDRTWRNDLAYGLTAKPFKVSAQVFAMYIHALSHYKSQANMLWHSKEEMLKQLRCYYNRTGNEKLHAVIWK